MLPPNVHDKNLESFPTPVIALHDKMTLPVIDQQKIPK